MNEEKKGSSGHHASVMWFDFANKSGWDIPINAFAVKLGTYGLISDQPCCDVLKDWLSQLRWLMRWQSKTRRRKRRFGMPLPPKCAYFIGSCPNHEYGSGWPEWPDQAGNMAETVACEWTGAEMRKPPRPRPKNQKRYLPTDQPLRRTIDPCARDKKNRRICISLMMIQITTFWIRIGKNHAKNISNQSLSSNAYMYWKKKLHKLQRIISSDIS